MFAARGNLSTHKCIPFPPGGGSDKCHASKIKVGFKLMKHCLAAFFTKDYLNVRSSPFELDYQFADLFPEFQFGRQNIAATLWLSFVQFLALTCSSFFRMSNFTVNTSDLRRLQSPMFDLSYFETVNKTPKQKRKDGRRK